MEGKNIDLLDGNMVKGRHRFPVTGDNKGSTLIEVIVSVLVIAIAFVPLMAGLNAALRTNKKTENELYAESVASNVVEICKTYGEAGLGTITSTKLNSLLTGSGSGGVSIEAIASDKLDSGVEAGFLIKGVTSGTEKEYKAKVEITSISGEQNDFTGYKPLSGFMNAVILSVPDFQSDIVTTFEAITGRNSENIGALWTDLKWLQRDINVNINPVSEDPTKYTVTMEVVFSICDEGYFQVKDGYTGSKTLTMEINDNKKYNLPLNPIVLSFKAPFGGHIGSDNLIINKFVNGDIRFNLLCASKDEYYHLNAAASASGEISKTVGVEGDYYQIDICTNDESASGWLNIQRCDGPFEFAADSTGQSMMKDIKISIYDSDNDAFTGTPTVVKTSTMIEYEAISASGSSTSGSSTSGSSTSGSSTSGGSL